MNNAKNRFESFLIDNNIEYEKRKMIPVNVPWSNNAPMCDFYIKKLELYVDVINSLSLERMFKIYYLMSQKNINYFFVSMTEVMNYCNDDIFSPSGDTLEQNILLHFSGLLNAIEEKITVDSLMYANMLYIQHIAGKWLYLFRDYNLNLLDFESILATVDPQEYDYCNSKSKFDHEWLLGYPKE